MIYEETYHYLLRNVSSTEFDTCLYSLLHSDWDGVIQSPLHMMASGVGTTEKYLKQIIKKFTSPQGCLQKVFVPVGQGGDVLYKFNLDLLVILALTVRPTVIARNTVSFTVRLSKT
ncbi:hypothetical protein P4534_19315 [Peribacillus butanolivorans]|uniref:hypothetical protein n=1 Tax=Peribacillus butanolivorans TaxID=421767 RepID=UPI002E1D8C8D|nr:hypothetical protein [Peribacillus butanolivorans]